MRARLTPRILAALGVAVAAAGLAACGSSAATTTASGTTKASGATNPSVSTATGSATSSSSSGGGAYGAYGGGSTGATVSTAASPARAGTVRVAHTSVGSILVNASGFTLYEFTADSPDRDRCVTVSGCASTWPPLTVTGPPTAGSGASQHLLATISLGHGRRQVTYAGHPLYRYSGDAAPAATSYIGTDTFGGHWYGVSASGRAVK
jgi:predicted lipoprotein with Yx(FWY)xxD motif